jgi:FkbM family methyltransferase
MINKLTNKIAFYYKKLILNDAQTKAFDRWFKDKGDKTLRTNYELDANSLVFDLGGYHGDFADEIALKSNAIVFVFEPVPEYYRKCVDRFKNNTKIKCFNYGLASKNEWLEINVDENASSFIKKNTGDSLLKVELRSITDFIRQNNIEHISLMKINIEGGEFDVIPELIRTGDIRKVKHLQIQFHKFFPNAEKSREEIRQNLSLTHQEKWNYEFVWESWSKIE